MKHSRVILAIVAITTFVECAGADVVTDWNATIRNVMQTDGILNTP